MPTLPLFPPCPSLRYPARASRGYAVLLGLTLALSLLLGACSSGGGGSDGAGSSAAAITIELAPVSQAVGDGHSAVLAVLARSPTALSYQWLRDGTAIADATGPTYVTPALSLADSGVQFAVDLRSASSGARTAAATITVQALLPSIAAQPQPLTVADGAPSTFTVQALGSQPLSYQWQRDGVDIAGAQAASYRIAQTTAADAGSSYRAVVRNPAGAVVSDAALLRITGAEPQVLQLMRLGVAAPGQQLLITTRLAGNPPFSYQWLRDGQPVAGAAGTADSTSVSLATGRLTEADHGARYALRVSTAEGSALSGDALIAVVSAPWIAAGGGHSLARSHDGLAVWAWGDNSQGQLGLGTTTGSPSPVRVDGLSGVRTLAAGELHSLALKSDGSVWAWGDNRQGALGDGTRTRRPAAQRVNGLSGIVAIAAGAGRSFALQADGRLWAWGDNASGALGLGSRNDALTPAQVGVGVPGFAGIVGVAAGARHSLALRADGRVFAMGEVAVPLAGGVALHDTPVEVAGLQEVAALAAGNGHAMALDNNGRLWTWGQNSRGQLGVGSTVPNAAPVAVGRTAAGTPMLPNLALAAGRDFSLAQPFAGPVLSWGAGDRGQLGHGAAGADASAPQQVGALLLPSRSVAAGGAHALTVTRNGNVYAWGANATGQLGIGSAESQRNEPVQLPGLDLDPTTD